MSDAAKAAAQACRDAGGDYDECINAYHNALPWKRRQEIGRTTLYTGDCREVLAALPEESFDACITDPPYGLRFMGSRWDYDVPSVETWAAVLRVLKPGAHLVAFGGTRTYHRLAVAVEDAGFEIRDAVLWHYGSGFPKSHDVSKAIDRMAGAEREVIGRRVYGDGHVQRSSPDKLAPPIGTFARVQDDRLETSPATDAARQWQGWGSALKPATEIAVLARKPLIGTIAANVLEHGTGAMNIDGTRIPTDWTSDPTKRGWQGGGTAFRYDQQHRRVEGEKPEPHALGRWPANVLHDGSPEVLAGFPETGGGSFKSGSARKPRVGRAQYGDMVQDHVGVDNFGDSGSAARFFYTAKASKAERGDGNTHPTVKPIALMRWLCRLVTPPGGHVLDPFAGSGTTGIAADREGFSATLIEQSEEYAEMARKRLAGDGPLFAGAVE